MKKILVLSAVIAFTAICLFTSPFHTSGRTSKLKLSDNGIPNKFLVALDEDQVSLRSGYVDAAREASDLAADYGTKVEKVFSNVIKGSVMEMTAKQAEVMSSDPRVRMIEQDSVMQAFELQPDADWGLDRVDQRSVPLNTSYVYSRTGNGVNVYVIDTGILPSHQDFGGRAVAAYDAVRDGQNGIDCNGHGTHVAGTIGGSSYGVAKRVNLYGVRVLGCNGLGSVSLAVEGIDWVTANRTGNSIANMSMGGGVSEFLDFVVSSAISNGLPFVAAAGNSNINACDVSPARVPAAITVGATDDNDRRWESSNYGQCLDMFAPGVGIKSAWIWNTSAANVGTGTSMAAPHVTGTAALYMEAHPTASPAEIAHQVVSKATFGRLTNIGENSPNLLVFTEPFAPTAANVSINGVVKQDNGRGLRNAIVELSGGSMGHALRIRTNAFGYYRFDDMQIGGLYTLRVVAKQYNFPVDSYSFILNEDLYELNFEGTPITGNF